MRTDFTENETGYEWRRDGWLAACTLTAALLVISAATPPAPGYDKFLRIFVFCVALVRAFAAFRRGGAWLPLSACVIAILFNPAAPIAMSRAAWVWCDLIAAAWFAIAGAWRLLRGWQPQRGWAAAAISLAALAVPAVAAMSMPNSDALKAADLDENLAEMNAADASASAAPTAVGNANASRESAEAWAQPTRTGAAATPQSSRSDVATARMAEAANRVNAPKKAAPIKEVEAPPFPGNDAASSDSETPSTAAVNNESGGNEEMER
jgi:hypothetical protein